MTALREEKAYFTRSEILASKDRWEMNAAHLVLRWNKCFFFSCVCTDALSSVFSWVQAFCVSLYVYALPWKLHRPPLPPWHCLLITQICAQSEEIMNESFNYASRQRIPDASTTPLARWDGWGQVKQEPSPLGAESWSALNTDQAYNLTCCRRTQIQREVCKMDSLI